MSENKRTAADVLTQALHATNSNYNPTIDGARLDAASALIECGLAARPGEDCTDSPARELSDREKLYAEVIDAVRAVSRTGDYPKDRVRAARLLLTWGET